MRAALLTAAVIALAGCQQADTRLEAARDVRTFLIAVKERDQSAFDRHVDKDALKADLIRQLRARAGEGDPAAALLASGQADRLLDGLITPEAFNFAVEKAGPALDRTPSAPEIAAVLKPAGEDRLCLPSGGRDGPCAAIFANQGGDWRLVSIATENLGVQSLPFPPSAAG